MKKKLLRVFALPLLAGLVTASSYGQEQKNDSQKINNANGEPGLIVFQKESPYKLQDANTLFKNQLQAGDNDTFVQIKSETDNLGYVHHKYQLQHDGIDVEFATYTLHAKNGRVNTMSGEFYNLKDVNTIPQITKEQGFQSAINHIGAESYLWDNADAANRLGYTKPEGELVLLPNLDYQGKDTANNAYLAYKYDIYATQPLSRGVLYIDAVTGAPLFYNSVIKHVGEHANSVANLGSIEHVAHSEEHTMAYRATGNAATRYSGTRTITTRKVGSPYALRDNTRGGGVNTYNSGGQNSYPNTNFTDANNDWTAAEFNNSNKDNAALDAHWGAEVTYDYWQAKHSRNSFDGSGAAINSWVHYDNQPGGAGYDNAFWNGSVMTYGDGSSNGNEGNGNFDALTSLDVAAHEVGHAVTSNTANLAYRRESGGLNEGFSDIWGAAIEHYGKGNGNDASPNADTWLIGEEIDRRSGVSALRSMSDPNSRNQPDTYGGTFWKNPNCGTPTQANDYCGVHTNSGVLNYWFYLSVAGGAGTNDIGNAFNVSGIGMDKAAKIAYRTLNNYLSANSTFANARTGAIQSAKDLYGAGGAEEIAVTNAWHAVGVGDAYPTGGGGGVTYCSSNGNSTNDEYIGRVQLGSINKTSGVGSTSTGYSDFTSTSTDLSVGGSSTITITPTWTGTVYDEGYAVFIDYNQDGDFTDSGETVWTKVASKTTPVSGSFTVPTGATSGTTRMRVSMKYNGVPTSCESFQYGEVEDYTVNITTGGGGGGNTGCVGGESAPYGEGFETSIGLWTQASGDDLNWTRDSGGTPSNGTGPSSGSQGANYIYVEASGNGTGYPSKRAVINSPCLDLNSASSATFTFDYHMYGSTDGGRVDLEASDDNGTTWTSIWNQTGNRGNQWNSVSINLSAYVGGGLQLRFNRITGGTWQSDVAIDNINLTASSTLTTFATAEQVTISDFDIKIYPNPVKGNLLNVSTFVDNLDYKIYNTLGQIVVKGQLRTNNINVSELEAALYIVEFSNENTKITKRFIKQ